MDAINFEQIQSALKQVRSYVEKEEFRGYDPYDILNSSWPFGALGKWGPIIAIQLQKRNPFNWRKILGVKKGYNPKGMGLLLHAYSYKYKSQPDAETRQQMDFLFDWLMNNSSQGYSGLCWGYNFDWASPAKYLKAYSPSIVVSGFVAKGIYAYYEATKDPKAADALKSIGDFVLKDLAVSEDESGTCFSYTTIATDACYNASMLGADLMAFLFQITDEQSYADKAKRLVDFTVAKQHADGHWNYNIDLATGAEKTQIDFHQGYVLDSIANVMKLTGLSGAQYDNALKKGTAYYFEEQFFPTGRSKWRIPRVWPVEIHNQSQGILTLSRLAHLDPQYLAFAAKIATWTIENMQDTGDGHFYYKKYPTHTIKVPYMRWAQAWMMLALTELTVALDASKGEKNSQIGNKAQQDA